MSIHAAASAARAASFLTGKPELMRGRLSEELNSPISYFDLLYSSEYTSTRYGAPTSANRVSLCI